MGKRTAVTTLAAAIMLLTAACGSGNDAKGPSSATSTAAGAGLAPWDENRKMSDMSGYASPIAVALGYDAATQDPSSMQAEARAQMRKQEEAIATCMKAEGWEYTPRSDEQIGISFQPPGYDLTRKEYVEKYGFGISTMTEEMNAQQPTNMAEDPNSKYMQSLSQSEMESYQKALYGDSFANGPPSADDSGSDSSGDGSTTATTVVFGMGGCMGKAQGGGTSGPGDQAFVQDIEQRLSAFYEKVQADPRVVAATRAYATCMAGKGFAEIDKQEAAYRAIETKMQGLYSGQEGPTDTTAAAASQSSGGAVAATIAVGVAGPGGGPPQIDEAKLAEVKKYEIGVAKADLACGKDVMKTTFEVSQSLEKAFVEQNAADLTRFKEIQKRGGIGG